MGKSILNCNGVVIELGKAINDKITEVKTKRIAVIFLNFFEIELTNGSINAPAIGTNTIKHKISLAFMYFQ